MARRPKDTFTFKKKIRAVKLKTPKLAKLSFKAPKVKPPKAIKVKRYKAPKVRMPKMRRY